MKSLSRLHYVAFFVVTALCLSCTKIIEEDASTPPVKERNGNEGSVVNGSGDEYPTDNYAFNPIVSQHDHLLTQYAKNGNTAYHVAYDNQRRVTSIIGSEGYAFGYRIDYDKKTITEKQSSYNITYHFSLNKEGYIDALWSDYSLDGHQLQNKYKYEYEGDYLKKATCEFYTDGKPTWNGVDYNEAIYQYENGNLKVLKYGDVAWVFTYGDTTNPDRLSPTGFCPLMFSNYMPDKCTMSATDLLYYSGLFGKVSSALPDQLVVYTSYLYDNLDLYEKNKKYYSMYVQEYHFTYEKDENCIKSMFMETPSETIPLPYNIEYQFE